MAARAAAARMAQSLSEAVGGRIGLRARMVSKSGPRTRVEVVTEGVFTSPVEVPDGFVYFTHDLDLLIGQDMGGNSLAASLITCACDAISYLKHGRRNRSDLFFRGLAKINYPFMSLVGWCNSTRRGTSPA